MDGSPRITLLISQILTLYKMRLNAFLSENKIDLTAEMCTILGILWKSDGRKQQEFADILFKDKGGITKIIDNLERRKLVVRIPDIDDRRTKIVTLTRRGHEMKNLVEPFSKRLLKRALGSINDEQLEISRKVLRSIIEQLK